MLFWLNKFFYEPSGTLSFLRLFNYISSRSIFAMITSFVIVLLLGRPVIEFLYKKEITDKPRKMGITNHQNKSGTPTMGGILLIIASLISVLLWNDLSNRFVQLLLFGSFYFALLGGIDDWLKLKGGSSSKGLSRVSKYIAQIGYGIIFGILFIHPSTSPVPFNIATNLYIPFYKYPLINLSWFYIIFIAIIITYCANAVNFADGLDGLAIVPSFFALIVYGIFAYIFGNFKLSHYLLFEFLKGAGEITVFSSALVGACVGFLWYNAYPAEIFMGDTGSMFLGGILGTIVVSLKQEVLFFLVGGIFLAEILSVVIQDWIGIQRIGRRIFFRAPLHHTFQHRGIGETKIVIRFWIVAGIFAIIGLTALKIR